MFLQGHYLHPKTDIIKKRRGGGMSHAAEGADRRDEPTASQGTPSSDPTNVRSTETRLSEANETTIF
jgi:hypothetical protein